MTFTRSQIVLLYAGSVLAASVSPLAAAPVDADFFEQKIRPVLAEKCFECHSAEAKSLKGNLLLDAREGHLKGGDTGPALVPGEPGKSLLISAIQYEDPDTAMPPKKSGGKLPAAVIADFEAWVKAGAPWPASATASAPKNSNFKNTFTEAVAPKAERKGAVLSEPKASSSAVSMPPPGKFC
jgi:hypothetical protein